VNRQTWLHWAETIDRLRVFPRLVLIGYAWYVWSVTFFILNWYAHQPAGARGFEESGVVGVVITAVTGFAPMIYKIYAQSSQPWDPQSSTTSTTFTRVSGPPPSDSPPPT
jgi:hypothetical protein